MPPLLADFSHARPCKPFCENSLTLPHRPEGRIFRAVNIQIDLALQKRKTRRKSCLSFCVQSADVGTSNYDTPRIPCSGTETLKGIIMYNFESILSLGVFWYTAKDLDYTKK